jgi:transcriptional regulator with XRE-family HTH domain
MAAIPKNVREAEAKALRELYEAQSPKPVQKEFAAAFGLGTSSMVYQYTNDRRPLNLDIATKFAHALGVPIEAFSPRLAALALKARNTSNAHMAPRSAPISLSAREAPPKPPKWPFPRIDEARVHSLERAHIRDLEAAMLLAAAQLGISIAKRRAA